MDSSNVTQNTTSHQVVVSNAYTNNDTGNSNINIPNPCDISPVSITTSLPNYNIHLAETSNTMVPNETNLINSSQPSLTTVTGNIVNASTNLSSVKIQDDLCLTESQLSTVHSLFQDANRVTRPEKAMIISFIAGSRGKNFKNTIHIVFNLSVFIIINLTVYNQYMYTFSLFLFYGVFMCVCTSYS